MLSFQSVTLRRGTRVLLEDVTLTIQSGEHWGIVGRNGSGKSSFMSLILGTRDNSGLHPDLGDIQLSPQLALAHVAQETPAVDRSALDYVMDGDTELRDIEAQLAEADEAGHGEHHANLFGKLESIDGYTAPTRAARLLNGLGFSEEQNEQPVNQFSGGWRMRLNLAQALMCRSDVLLLDEPTNHLDLDAVLWLQTWLQNYPGTVLLISHDRDFLDNCVNHIALLSENSLHEFTGNYSAYEKQHAARLEQQQAAHRKQQRTVAHLHSYIDRFRAKATKAKQAQSRLKALAKLEIIAPAHVDSPFEFTFLPPQQIPNPLLKLIDSNLGYENKPLIQHVNINLLPGDRIGLLGPNGAGKSTLIKTLANKLTPLTGNYQPAQNLKIGYFAQHQLEQLHVDDSPLLHLQRLDKKNTGHAATEQELRNYLGGFGFVGDQALDPVGPFSGGEKARLVLALLIYQRPNLLLLDEPTNHLDLEMRHALTLALQDFQGAMVIVSHDRHLLRTVCDQFMLVANGEIQSYDGDLEDYAQWLSDHRRRPAASKIEPGANSNKDSSADSDKNSPVIDKQQKRQHAADIRKQLKPLRDQAKRSEKVLSEFQKEQTKIEHKMANSDLYLLENKDELTELLSKQVILKKNIILAEDEWMDAMEKLDQSENNK